MVKILVPSFTVFLLAITAVKAQTPIVIADYPPINAVPPVSSPQVQAWLKEIDLTGAPDIPKLTAAKGTPPACKPPTNPPACPADDITVCKAANTWGLTFDDGPSTATPTLLDFLKTNSLKASFFLIGSNVIQHPEIVKRELTEGHHLASHTWSHTALTTLSNEEIVAEMKWTEKAVLAATGLKMKYMRPPYGDINNRVRFVLKKLGYIPVDWTGDAFDTNDWRIVPKDFPEEWVVGNFSKSLDTYVASPKTTGFYCLEHDVSVTTVNAALKLVPLGLTRKINFASVAGCENDPAPYQSGGTAPMPSSNTGNTGKGTNPSSTGNGAATGPTVLGKSAGAREVVSAGFVSAVALAVAGALLA
ncbi:chitin deacetylase [Mortierella claussenii]|nr:chitin deacetylase [Mortierella claussenii]